MMFVVLPFLGSFEDNGCGCESHFGITKSAEALLEKTKNYLLGVLQKYNGCDTTRFLNFFLLFNEYLR